MKMLEHVEEGLIRKRVGINEMQCGFMLGCFFLIEFNVPFKIISLIETSQSIGGAKLEYPGKTT